MWGKRLIALLLILLVCFLGLIFLIFKSRGLLFRLELLLVVVLLFISFITILGVFIEERWSWTLAFILFTIFIANLLIFRYFVRGHILVFAVTLATALIGFAASIINLGSKKEPKLMPHIEGIEEKTTEVPKIETYGEEEKKKEVEKKASKKSKRR